MEVIYKYPMIFNRDGFCAVEVPAHSNLLKVDVQGDSDIMGWFMHTADTGARVAVKRTFRAIMTGEKFDHNDNMKFIDTVFKGWIVCHIFECF